MAKRSTGVAVGTGSPGYLEKYRGQAQQSDNFDQSDVTIPRIKLLQGLSKECENFDAARPGRFWHTGFDTNLGESVRFIVCSRNKKYLLVAPLDDGQGILARAEDAKTWDRLGKWEVKTGKTSVETWEITDLNLIKSGLTEWRGELPPIATLFYDYLVLTPDFPDHGPSVISLARSQIKRAKKGLNDKIKLHQQADRPMQAILFKAESFDDRNTVGKDFKNWAFTGDGFAEENWASAAMEFANAMFKVADEQSAAGDEQQSNRADEGGEY